MFLTGRWLFVVAGSMTLHLLLPANSNCSALRFPVGDAPSGSPYSISQKFQDAPFTFMGTTYSGHLGEDWAVDVGTDVFPIAPGRIVRSRDFGPSWCNVVIIAHANLVPGRTIYSLYAHLIRRLVGEGDDLVDVTKPIGQSGGPQCGYKPHLHFEIKDYGTTAIVPGHGYTQQPSMNVDQLLFEGVTYFRPSTFIILGSTPPVSGPFVTIDPGTQADILTVSSPSVPIGVAVDGIGNVFVAENGAPFVSGQVVELPAGGGAQTTVGMGLVGPAGVAVDTSENVYIVDNSLSQVFKVLAGGGLQSTVGTGLSGPFGVAVDGVGNVYIADAGNHRVVKVSAGGGPQVTLPVTGLVSPFGVAVDIFGNVYIADEGNNDVVELPAGGAQTTVGSGLSFPYDVSVDGFGNVYIADTIDNRIIEVLAGNGTQMTVPITGLDGPRSIALDVAGNFYISNFHGGFSGGFVIKLNRSQASLSFGFQNVGVESSAQTITLTNIGNQPLVFQSLGFIMSGNGSDFSVQPGATNPCSFVQGNSMAVGASCTLSVSYTPTAVGTRSATLTLLDNAANPLAQVINLTGSGSTP